jgi:hypothetical protein
MYSASSVVRAVQGLIESQTALMAALSSALVTPLRARVGAGAAGVVSSFRANSPIVLLLQVANSRAACVISAASNAMSELV